MRLRLKLQWDIASSGRCRPPPQDLRVMSARNAIVSVLAWSSTIRQAGGSRLVRADVLAIIGVGVFLDARPTLLAQAENGWIGKRVVQKYADFTLKIENRVNETNSVETYRVEHVNGPWLWLRVDGEGLSGWVLADQ